LASSPRSASRPKTKPPSALVRQAWVNWSTDISSVGARTALAALKIATVSGPSALTRCGCAGSAGQRDDETFRRKTPCA
jgi:hypothetical protein